MIARRLSQEYLQSHAMIHSLWCPVVSVQHIARSSIQVLWTFAVNTFSRQRNCPVRALPQRSHTSPAVA